MQCIIFSFNRASQLDTLLNSIRVYLGKLPLDIHVVYNSSEDFYEEGYRLLFNLYPEVNFKKEKSTGKSSFPGKSEFFYWRNYFNFLKYPPKVKGGSFKSDVNRILDASDAKRVFFLTDDSVFVREPDLPGEVTQTVLSNPAHAMFSFRHGLNQLDAPPESVVKHTRYSHYRVTKGHAPHWVFKFSIDGHVYDKQFIRRLSAKNYYYNPNSLEAFINTYSTNKNYFSNLYFNNENSLLGFELNRVQSFNVNNHLDFSTHKLNTHFMEGYKLTYLYDVVTDFRPLLTGLKFANGNENFQIKF